MAVQLLFIISLALIHLHAGKLRFLQVLPRSAWLSLAGGVSVAYVFIHVFPELEEAQRTLGEHGTMSFLKHHAYLVSLIGLSTFYGLERLVKLHSHKQVSDAQQPSHTETTALGVFWLHIGSFTLYNALIGYLLVYQEMGHLELLFYFLAMGCHFLVNDYGLFQHHLHAYRAYGRWVLSTAVVVGWGIGMVAEVSEAATSVLFAFLAGGIVLNVLKEELPEERQSRFWPFALGVVLYSLFLLMA